MKPGTMKPALHFSPSQNSIAGCLLTPLGINHGCRTTRNHHVVLTQHTDRVDDPSLCDQDAAVHHVPLRLSMSHGQQCSIVDDDKLKPRRILFQSRNVGGMLDKDLLEVDEALDARNAERRSVAGDFGAAVVQFGDLQ